ncbi:auxilin-like protein 1 isoform X1 [Culex quinquefasciatus]|uniref:auxilin-like protein 1 isoform X1 n=1 Tax=Culex quinquefasciatus TaxID=7176 RepID=UPI0018E2EC07|nr:auxilin-like protein 1 isoform X1 [Culex quinquefasciatus]
MANLNPGCRVLSIGRIKHIIIVRPESTVENLTLEKRFEVGHILVPRSDQSGSAEKRMPITTTPKVPDGLPELMRGLAKSVIKENPDNIYVHAAEYFENLIRERDGELDKGYGSFSAYKVYSDYKDKCREKGVPVKAVSDGDDDDSGGSASAAARGRRRKRVRKQGSKDSGKSVEKEDVPGSASSGGGGENLSSIKEDAPLTEKTVEEEPIKVEKRKVVQTALSKAISIDSEAAANAVSTVLEDTVLDSDEADREAEEPLEEAAEWVKLKQPINCEDLSSYPVEDYGSAPSTAEVVGDVVGDGEHVVEDAPPTEETDEKNSDEVDLTVSEKPEVEEPVVNGSVEADVESPKKMSEEQLEEEGIDTVDAENNEEIAIQPRMETENEDEVPDMPEVPTEDPGVQADAEETAQEDAETPISDENLTENVENGAANEDPQPENQDSSHEKKNEDGPNSENNSPQKSEEQESSEPAKQESQTEENPKSDEGSPEQSNSIEEAQLDTNAKESSLEKSEPEANGNEEQAEELEEPASASSPKKLASVDEIQTSNQSDAPGPETESPMKAGSIDAEVEATVSDENQKTQSGSGSSQKSASIEETNEPVEGTADAAAMDGDQISDKDAQLASGSASPVKPASIDEHQQSKEQATPPPESEKTGSIDATNESVGENQAEQDSNTNQDDIPATESGSIDAAANEESPEDVQVSASQEDEKQQEDESSQSPKKSASIEEANKPTSEDQVTQDDEEPAEGSSSPKKSASVEDQETSEPAKQDSQNEEPQTEDNPKSGEGSPEKSGSIEDPAPETNSKESSLEKTESEPNVSGEQSKESSAKESEGDATASKQDGASEEAGEISIGSRMGAEDENDEQEGSPEPSAPPSDAVDDNNSETVECESKNDEDKAEGSKQNSVEDEGSKEEAVEEPCIQRQVSPSTSKPLSKNHSTDLEEIKKVDLASFSKDSAEALFYSLKQTELANEEAPKKDGQQEDDDDADVVLGEEEAAPAPISRQLSKRSFTDDFLEKGPITEEAPKQAEGDGVAENDEQFDPMMIATVRNQQLQEQLHSRDDTSLVGSTQRKTPIRRSMTERADLVKQDSNYVDLRKYDPDYVQEEDDFDGYYIGNIRNKILASSVSVADSDDFDPRQSQEMIDDNNVRTALETIASTDTESTLPSQITVQANRGFLKNTSSNIPYASFGNNAIDQSLDDFIEREEQNKEAEEQAAASKIQRSYRQFRSNKKKLLRDYHSTMQTCTEDQSSESLEEYPNNIIKIKVDPKQPEAKEGEESENNSIEDGRAENRRRPMYSLNIDEYDTAARRMTLTRGVAMQRTSTPEEDSGKSDNKKSPPLTSSEPETKVAEGSTISTSGPSSTEDKKEGGSSSDEKENKDTGSSKSNDGSKVEVTKARPLSDSRKHTSLDAQKLFIARQRTMPVQIDASVIRVLPKHMRKRNKSAGMVRK